MMAIFKSFSVVIHKFDCNLIMASAGAGGQGKGVGQGGGYSGKGYGQGGREVVWPVEDFRNTKPGSARKQAPAFVI